jgi:hypothetical protein
MSTAPRVTEADVENAIKDVKYVVLPDGRTTIACVTLDNGYTVRGESSCVCIENFDAETGEHWSLKDAKEKIWPLLGFRLADTLAKYGIVESAE